MALSDEPVPAAVGHAEHGHRRDLDRPAIGPIVTSAVTVFGIVAAFVSVQNEPGKLWNLGAALISTVPIGVGAWIWRSAVPATRAGAISRIIGALTIFAALPLFWLGVIINPAKGETSAVPSPAPQSSASEFPSDTSTSRPSQAATDAGPAIDIRMHEVWASSSENSHYRLEDREWVATTFPVTEPYLRSVEVAAGPVGLERAQLIVYDEHQQELASCDAGVGDYRAKCIFEVPINVSPYVGRHLYLMLKNVSSRPMTAYFTKNDRDRSVTSYVDCGRQRIVECPNPVAQDLSALVIGWSHLP